MKDHGTPCTSGQFATLLSRVIIAFPKALDHLQSSGFDVKSVLRHSNEGERLSLALAEAFLMLYNGSAKTIPMPRVGSLPETIIRIDHSTPLAYPEWVEEVKHPELENTGPSEYDLSSINLWLHDEQRNGGGISGNKIYEHLKNKDLLETCLGLRDGLEIQKKGLEVFRKFFGDKSVCLWKSVVLNRDGGLSVPYLCGSDGVMYWRWLGYDWVGHYPAARSAS